MYKKIIAAVLAVTLTVGGMSLPAEVIGDVTDGISISVSAATYGNFKYKTLSNGTVEITKYTGKETTVKIPSEINGKAVTSIGNESFNNCETIKSITIPSGVTKLGTWAFSYCTSLTSITLPNSLKTIGDAAFYNCKSLKSITIPSGVKKFGDNPFSDCTNLASINVDKNNKYFTSENGILFNKDKTELIRCPSGNTTKSYVIPGSVTKIGDAAFEKCKSLTNITIPKSVKDIGNDTFCECSSLKSIKIPNGVTTIGAWTFSGCTSLKSITIPDSVTSIEDFAFWNSYNIKSMTIPDSVTNIGLGAVGFSEYTVIEGFKLYCNPGSAAEAYAIESGIDYESPYVSVDKVTLAGFTSKTNSVTIKWNKVSGATGYRVYRYNASNKKWTTITTVKDNKTQSYTQAGLKAGTVYKYKVKAYVKKNDVTSWSDSADTIATATKYEAVKFTKTSSSKTSVKLCWNNVPGADGYRLQKYDTAQKKWITVNAKIGSSVTEYKITELNKNTSYKFRIQAYKKVGSTKVYGEWSATKTVKTAK